MEAQICFKLCPPITPVCCCAHFVVTVLRDDSLRYVALRDSNMKHVPALPLPVPGILVPAQHRCEGLFEYHRPELTLGGNAHKFRRPRLTLAALANGDAVVNREIAPTLLFNIKKPDVITAGVR